MNTIDIPAQIRFAGSTREVPVTKLQQFNVVQNNKTQTIHVADYELRDAPRQMIFLNLVEAILNDHGRYVKAQSNKDNCAFLVLPEEGGKDD